MASLPHSTIKKTSSSLPMTPSQHSKQPRSQSARSPCFLTSKRSSINLQRSSPSLWHLNRTRELRFMFKAPLRHHSDTHELSLMQMPSLRHHNVTHEFLFTLNTIEYSLNGTISCLTHNLCTNDLHTHLQIVFASSVSNTFLATAPTAFSASKHASLSMKSMTQRPLSSFESFVTSAAK